jgi:predicted  nucleic acid-binding Zn-ribbon protein
MAKKTDPTDRMIAVLERIAAELRGVKAEAKETNERLGRVEAQARDTNERLGRVEARLAGVETQAKRTNRRLGALEKRLTLVEVPAIAALGERVGRLEAAVFKPAAE